MHGLHVVICLVGRQTSFPTMVTWYANTGDRPATNAVRPGVATPATMFFKSFPELILDAQTA